MARIGIDLVQVLPALAAQSPKLFVQASFGAVRVLVDVWVADNKALNTNSLHTAGAMTAGPASRWAAKILELLASLEEARATEPDAETLCKAHRVDVALLRFVANDLLAEGSFDYASAVRMLEEIIDMDQAAHPALRHMVR